MTVTSSSPSLESALSPFARFGETFARHTTMRVGGPVAWWAEPQSEDELSQLLATVERVGAPMQVLGAGSNLVAADNLYDGVVLHLGSGFGWTRVEGDQLITGGATLLPKLTKVALANRLGFFEWACGIPGTAGGSIWGNAGARGFNGREFEGRDCAADLVSLVAFDRSGKRHELGRRDIEFSYRKSSLGDLVVTQASFRLKPLSEEEAQRHREAQRELLAKRRDSQPVNQASAGCIWKNPSREACDAAPRSQGCRGAGELVERLGLKGEREGGAVVSSLHGNFIVNEGGATGDEVRALAARVEERARELSGVPLEREVRFLEY
jgi:UDP-N-acetylenolpyruvoylglucosamine reductase